MKNIGFILLVGLLAFSCVKNRTCECKVDFAYSDPILSYTVIKDTKSNAQVECNAIKSNLDATYAGTGAYVECNLK